MQAIGHLAPVCSTNPQHHSFSSYWYQTASRAMWSERDICTKYITPALKKAGWDINSQIREEVTLTAGRVIVKGQMGLRAKGKRADYVLYHKPNLPLAVVHEARL